MRHVFFVERERVMNLDLAFFLTSISLGIALAMDAFSVSLANGLREPCMRKSRMCGMAGMFAFCQALMPLIGWVCVHSLAEKFEAFEKAIPWIALGLLTLIGGKMLIEGIKECGECKSDDDQCLCARLGFGGLIVQGIATSIDALSVGFTISHYNLWEALFAVLIIAAVTFVICLFGLLIGRQVGTKLSGKAGILGGVILIAIGLEIFITGLF